jgi:hypothetical protein
VREAEPVREIQPVGERALRKAEPVRERQSQCPCERETERDT